MKVAIIHDYLNQYGGAERVLECFMDLFPDAPIYTLLSDLSKMPDRFQTATIRNSFIQKVLFSRSQYKKMLGLLPLAIEQFDLREFDLVLSTSSAFAKGVITNPAQIHICYCHTPMRYVWDLYHQYLQENKNPIYKTILPFILHKIRNWDQLTAQRVDHFVANSYNVAKRISKYYGRESTVIHPPVQFDRYSLSSSVQDYFLIVSRLIPYKRIDIVIEAFNELNWPLVIIGDGYDRKRLEGMAGPSIKLLGYQSDEIIAQYYSNCRAFIMAGEEDFGITPLEAQASGRPVIAFRKGGALETVVEYKTGLFFDEQTSSSLINTLRVFDSYSFDPVQIRNHAESFSEENFKEKIMSFIRGVTT
jgi:glycosyltransferase involved in cell wall biosynthesis